MKASASLRVALASALTIAACFGPEPLRAHQRVAAGVDMQGIGPAVGAAVPDFELVDQDGGRRSLESLMGPNGVVLVFFRSADW
jgi:hypothetical protein